MATVWTLLVNWNGAADTIRCGASLLAMTDQDMAVVIVDNGSTGDDCSRIAAWAERAAPGQFARVRPGQTLEDGIKIALVECGRNLGFAAANNVGMALASGHPQVRYFWLLNNDTIVAEDSLSVQRARMEQDGSIGMLGARLMFYDQPDTVQGLAGGFHYWRARGYHIGLGAPSDDLPPSAQVERAMRYVLGASMFVRRAAVEACGPMCEDYFLYFEEIDWAERMVGRYRLAVAMDAVVWHKEGGTIGSSTHGRPSDTSLYYLQASLLRFYWRRHRLLMPVAMARTLREVLGLAKQRDWRGCLVIRTALTDVLMKRPRRGRYGSEEFERMA